MASQLTIFDSEIGQRQTKKIVNVASVPQRSPFRYPGGKTWLIPTIRKWLLQRNNVVELIEPFAGGGIVGLTAAFEKLADHITMTEIDEEVAAVWEVILSDQNEWLANKIFDFDLTHKNIQLELDNPHKSNQDVAFCTILKNRIFHGGIITKGSGLIKNGENGKGIHSRWYPKTLRDRILAINYVRKRISFRREDAFDIIERNKNNKDIYYFIDPPYTIAGKRLYTYFDVNHDRLFTLISQTKGKFLLTYDDTEEIRGLAKKNNLKFKTVDMKTTHHLEKREIIISDNFEWWD
ncbi:MAG: DNA adenine methylase [Bacteroidia bacterium]|nr:DNA adenine methylase [Bacteroidia bacterium]